jgi:hypothetical protein
MTSMKTKTTNRASLRRRSFLARLGLGAGAFLLGPSVNSFVREARGQTGKKRFVLMVQGNGMNYRDFAPPGFKPQELKAKAVADKALHQGPFTQLPNMFKGMEAHIPDMILCDGLSNQTGEYDHSVWYGATTCVPNNPVGDGQPGGISFDQYLAQGPLGQGMVYPSMTLGCHHGGKGEGGTSPDKTLQNIVFASGPGKPVPVVCQVTAAYKQYIAAVVKTPATMSPTAPPPFARRKKLLDFVREDVRRTQAALASVERQKLEQVLGSFEALDKRMAELTMRAPTGEINLQPIATEPELEDRVKLHFQIWATGLIANLTNVVAFSAEATSYECMWKGLGFRLGAHQHGHGEWSGEPLVQQNPGLNPLDEVHKFHAGLLGQTIANLKAVKEGNGSLFDNTTIMWLNDGAEVHHPLTHRFPLLIAAGANSGLRTGGRFVRYPVFESIEKAKPTARTVAQGRPTGGRCLADMYCTMAHALGVPTDTFGSGGTELVQGALPEIKA